MNAHERRYAHSTTLRLDEYYICNDIYPTVDILPRRSSRMKQTKRDPEELLPLSLSVFHTLLALADQGRHGYGIMKETAARTDGKVKLGPGILYGNIKRLIEEGLIEK